MGDPLFWLGLSLLLVAVSLTAMLMVAIPTLRELSRAARSAEKLFDTLGRELPPTLETLRLTGLELTELTDDVSDSVQHAGRVVQQVDEGLSSARQQAKSVHNGTRSFLAGAKAAWQAWSQPRQPRPRKRPRKLSSKPSRTLTTRTAPQVPPTRPAAPGPARPPTPKIADSLPPSADPDCPDADASAHPVTDQSPLPDPWELPGATPVANHQTATPDVFVPGPSTAEATAVEGEATKPSDSPELH